MTTTKPTYTYKEIKEYLQAQSAIKFNGLSKEDVGNKLNVFFDKLLVWNKERDTVFTNNKLHTNAGKRRSIGDLYRITYFYFPKVKLITVYRELLEIIGKGAALSSICMETGLRVYRYTDKEAFFNGTPIDEFGTDITTIEGYEKCKPKVDYWGYEYTEDNIKFVQI